jgi:hypothetical protein
MFMNPRPPTSAFGYERTLERLTATSAFRLKPDIEFGAADVCF